MWVSATKWLEIAERRTSPKDQEGLLRAFSGYEYEGRSYQMIIPQPEVEAREQFTRTYMISK